MHRQPLPAALLALLVSAALLLATHSSAADAKSASVRLLRRAMSRTGDAPAPAPAPQQSGQTTGMSQPGAYQSQGPGTAQGNTGGNCCPTRLALMGNENVVEHDIDCDPNIWDVWVWGETEPRDLRVKVIDQDPTAYYNYKDGSAATLGLPNTAWLNVLHAKQTEDDYLMMVYNKVGSPLGKAGTASLTFPDEFMLKGADIVVKDDPQDNYRFDPMAGSGQLTNTWLFDHTDGWVLGPIQKLNGGCFRLVVEKIQVDPHFIFKLGMGDELPNQSVKELKICRPGCF